MDIGLKMMVIVRIEGDVAEGGHGSRMYAWLPDI